MSLIYNIGRLVGIQPEGVLRVQGQAQGQTGELKNAWLRIEDGRIAAFGPMSTCPERCPIGVGHDGSHLSKGGNAAILNPQPGILQHPGLLLRRSLHPKHPLRLNSYQFSDVCNYHNTIL